MTKETRAVLIRILTAEIEAFETALRDRPPSRSIIPPHDLMTPGGDQRELWLFRLRIAMAEV